MQESYEKGLATHSRAGVSGNWYPYRDQGQVRRQNRLPHERVAPTLEKIPFSVYDFFAYLSSGAVLVATADYVLGLGLLTQKEPGPVLAVLLIILAYVCGHIVAHFSSFILEHIAVGRILRRPAALLLGEPPRWVGFAWVFPNYFRAFPQETRRRINQKAELRGFEGKGEGLFLHVYPIVTSSSELQSRLDGFRNQYGFARNMSFAFFVASSTILIAHRFANHPVRLRWAVLASAGAVTLFYRYLKFFRQYSYELF